MRRRESAWEAARDESLAAALALQLMKREREDTGQAIGDCPTGLMAEVGRIPDAAAACMGLPCSSSWTALIRHCLQSAA